MTILNSPPMERYLDYNKLQIAVIPGTIKHYNGYSFLRPLMDKLMSLQSIGMQVIRTDDEIINATAHLLFATGDIPAAATLCNHEGHMAIYGCRICIIKTTRLQSIGGTGYDRYFPGSLDTDDAIRDHIQFAKGGLGIRGRIPFVQLYTYHAPFFHPIDEMHPIGCNTAPHLYKLTKSESGTLFSLSGTTIKKNYQFHNTCSKSFPPVFEGKFTDVFTRPNQARAVDYIDMLLYIGPTLLLESFVKLDSCSDEAITAFISIITVCSLGLKWEIDNEDIEVMESARCMERTVGLLSRRIKSKSAIAENAQNQMVMLAAYRDLEKIDLAAMTMTNEDDGSESNQAPNDDRIFQLGSGSDEIQIFNVHQSLLNSYNRWNLKNLIQNYWTRKYPHEQGHIIDEIIVGTVLHIQGNIFSSEINKEPKNARIRNFVQLSLVYDVYARQSYHAANWNGGRFMANY
ncbi:hypothetical protein INT45_005909 [Circinella minor]|uniref:Uncharacterized protein n=1 Tax=Circinella minor TaxID=1195481 RepID=A0A8H7V955_9FUNG|nr:hypothetical protein INT45_005909 [Circinella minor]